MRPVIFSRGHDIEGDASSAKRRSMRSEFAVSKRRAAVDEDGTIVWPWRYEDALSVLTKPPITPPYPRAIAA
jgi:hypothetical protein